MPGELRGKPQVVGLMAKDDQSTATTVNGIASKAIVGSYVER